MKVTKMSLKEDTAIQAVMAAPSTGVAVITIAGYPLSDVILIGTAILLVLQIGYLLHKWVRLALDKETAE
jgi:uncharacterized membrane protein